MNEKRSEKHQVRARRNAAGAHGGDRGADWIVVLSRSPGRVAEIVGVTLPRPRDQIATKADEAFARYREHLLGLVMSR